MAVAKPLVIVESPAKARTISKFLGPGYVVESSIGHIRDLPKNAAEIPLKFKKEPWSRLGVDTENDFKPLYVVSKEKTEQVRKLKHLLKESTELYLATDEDREGESIAWHLLEVLSPKVTVKRMVFHEITERAIHEAIQSPRTLDRRLVDAQETRRILDRLYGYEVSPVLWRKILPRLSAGRVQSVACRVIVDRERARIRFRSAEYFDIEAQIVKDQVSFSARMVYFDNKKIAGSRDFIETGHLSDKATKQEVLLLDQSSSHSIIEALHDAEFVVKDLEEKPYRKSPAAPFMTSTLQQEAGRKLRFSSQRTMSVAQRLYENGYITYMRTDSIQLSESAIATAREIARARYGESSIPKTPRRYKNKVKNAQEAHEAIRPAGDSWKTLEEVSRELGSDDARLYELIWKRTVSSQMNDAIGTTATVRLSAKTLQEVQIIESRFRSGTEAEFSISGRIITSPGFQLVYVEGSDEVTDNEDRPLPKMAVGERYRSQELAAISHITQPPARFTEASLVKTLEELGVGRPSTYASIISTILERRYAWKKGQALIPTFLAFAVVNLLEQHFGPLVDFSFTAEMEDSLDEIADGSKEAVPYLKQFYFGNGKPGLKPMIEAKLEEIDARSVSTLNIGVTQDGRDVAVRVGRYGPFVQVGDSTASIPEETAPDELSVEMALELIEGAKNVDRQLGIDPESSKVIYVKVGRFGPYVQLGEADEKTKPKTASLLRFMDPSSITLADALQCLSLPRVIGVDPDSKETIVAQNGPYGPYVQRGKDTRSLQNDEEIFTVTLEQALHLLSQPKTRRARGTSTSSTKELGVDPLTNKIIQLKSGRFGPYVTDGEVNASLGRSHPLETLTIEDASDLLSERRSKLMAEGVDTTKAPKRKPRSSAPRKRAKKS